MNTGHMNIASTPTAMPFAAREAPAAATMEGTPKSDSDFDKLLGGQQLSTHKNTPAESDQAEPAEVEARSNVTFVDVTSQLALAAYLQPGIPEADNKPAALSVDMQQNATMTIEAPVVITDPSLTPEALLPVDRLQNVAMATEALSAQKQQQLEATRIAGGDILSVKTESAADAAHATDKILNETLSLRQRHSSEPQTEKIVDESSGKDAAATPGVEGSDGVTMAGSESSISSDSKQGEPGGAYDNPDMAQNMPGQLVVDQQKVSATTARTAGNEPLRQDISNQVMPQIKERFEQHEIKPGKQQITLTLSPDTLGEIKMNLNLQGEKLSIEIVTESRSVRDAIVQHVDALKESLARQNITMESFDVTTGGKGSGSQGQNQNAWRELAKQQQQQQLWASPRGYATAQADSPSGAALPQRRQGQSMLDIHY